MTDLLERHGQGGRRRRRQRRRLLVLLPHRRPHLGLGARDLGPRLGGPPGRARGGAISNRLTLRSRLDPGVAASRPAPTSTPGATRPRPPVSPTGVWPPAAPSCAPAVCVAVAASWVPVGAIGGARHAVAHLRDHGTGPWGAPGSGAAVVPAPTGVAPTATGRDRVHAHPRLRGDHGVDGGRAARRARRARACLGGPRQPVRLGLRPRPRPRRRPRPARRSRRAGRGVGRRRFAALRSGGRARRRRARDRAGRARPPRSRRCGTRPTTSTPIPARWRAFASSARAASRRRARHAGLGRCRAAGLSPTSAPTEAGAGKAAGRIAAMANDGPHRHPRSRSTTRPGSSGSWWYGPPRRRRLRRGRLGGRVGEGRDRGRLLHRHRRRRGRVGPLDVPSRDGRAPAREQRPPRPRWA